MTIRRAWTMGPMLAAALLFAACDVRVGDGNFSIGILSGKASDQWTRTYTLAVGGEVEVANDNGAIEVVEGAGDLEIRAERTVKGSSDEAARDLLKKIEMSEHVTPTRVRVEAKLPRGGGLTRGLTVNYQVRVPAGVRVRVEAVNGSIKATGLSGRLDAETTNGSIKAHELSGPVKAATVNGALEVGVKAVPADGVELTTVNGGVDLSLPASVKADIDASCTNGRVSIGEGLNLQTTEDSARRVEGRLNGGGPRVRLETTNGRIHVGVEEPR